MSTTSELIFIPAPGSGHLTAAIQLAQTLIHRSHRRISVTFLCLKSPMSSSINDYIDSLSLSFPDIRFLIQPPVPPSPDSLVGVSIETLVSLFIESHKAQLKSTVAQLISESGPSRVTGLVVDLFFTTLIDIGTELGLPTYIFFSSNAAFLGLMLHLPILHTQFTAEFLDSETEFTIPSYANPVPPTVFPSAILNKKDDAYNWFVYHGRRFTESNGIIVNTFAELEPFAINSIKSGSNRPVYQVGPILTLDPRKARLEPGQERVLRWLDEQQPGSVVVLCFGSMGRLSAEQVREIAVGLERSEHRFVWALRKPAMIGDAGPPKNESGAGSGLPEGVAERVCREGKGVVLEEEWLPQVEVLGHVAVGGFVSHCGWNSVLESLWFGVPIATWPLYAEQQLNAFALVRELGVGIEIRMDYRMGGGNGGLVSAEEVDRGVRKVMEKESEVRKRVEEMKEKSRRAVAEGGSSFEMIERFIGDVTKV